MKPFDLQPTPENLLSTYKKDSIGRNEDLHSFIDILDLTDYSCSIALDGRWGSGKTFFVKQAKMILDCINNKYDEDTTTKTDIESQWKNYAQREKDRAYHKQVAVYYDAWENDNDEDPILSIIFEILQSSSCKATFSNEYCGLLASIATVLSGRDFSKLSEALKGQNSLEEIQKSRDIREKINEFFNEFFRENGERLVIFVDELDRCKPSYAVKVLERIKHYFANDKITFVFSINAVELQKTIRRYYGDDFDSSRYLDRFFDLRISLPPVDMTKYLNTIGINGLSNDYCHLVSFAVMKTYHFEMRDIARYMRQINMGLYDVINKEKYTFEFDDGLGRKFTLMCFVPIIIGLKMVDINLYDDFISGNDYSPLVNVLKDADFSYNLCASLLESNEGYDEIAEGIKNVSLENKLKQAYDAVFKFSYTNRIFHKEIGKASFSAENKKIITRAESLLSKYSNHNI